MTLFFDVAPCCGNPRVVPWIIYCKKTLAGVLEGRIPITVGIGSTVKATFIISPRGLHWEISSGTAVIFQRVCSAFMHRKTKWKFQLNSDPVISCIRLVVRDLDHLRHNEPWSLFPILSFSKSTDLWPVSFLSSNFMEKLCHKKDFSAVSYILSAKEIMFSSQDEVMFHQFL